MDGVDSTVLSAIESHHLLNREINFHNSFTYSFSHELDCIICLILIIIILLIIAIIKSIFFYFFSFNKHGIKNIIINIL